MKMSRNAIALSLLTAAASGTPTAKVLDLLAGLQKKVTKEGEESAKVHAAAGDMCNDKSKDVGFAIETGNREIEGLKAAIAKETSKSDELTTKVDELVKSIAEAADNLAAAQKVRATDAADFAAEEKELLSVIDTLERAIGILEKELNGASSSVAMLQVKNAKGLTQALQAMVEASMMGSADAARLASLSQVSASDEAAADDAALGAPAAAVYENKSGGIVDTLNGLLDQAHSQLSAARKKETSGQHEFALLEQSLNDDTAASNKDLSEAKAGIAESGEAKAVANGDLAAAKNALDADNNDLAELKQYCANEADDYATELKNRAEELAALKAAIDAISEATGAAAQVSFLQLKSDLGFKAATFLRQLAHGKDGSAALAQLASRVSSTVRLAARAGNDPFSKVKGLISDMIAKLEKEASADATKKAYCDKETADSTSSKNEKAADVEKLTVRIDRMAARSASLKEEVATLEAELAALAKAQVEMDKVRSAEKANFDADKPELEAGIKGVQVGAKILKEYYGSSGSDSKGAVNSILGFLEVIEADFSKALAQRSAAEDSAQAEYEKMTQQNKVTRTSKEQDRKYKEQEMTTLASDIAAAKADRESKQTELDSVLDYLAELNKMCVAKAETYGERAAKRAAEIAGLKEALDILNSEAGFLQRGTLRGVKKHA